MRASTRMLAAAIATAAVLSSTPSSSAQPVYRTSAEGFLSANPGIWRVVADPITENPSFLYGARISLETSPRSDVEFEAAARMLVDDHPDLFAVASSDLDLVRVHTLELSRVGSSDKVAVLFRQVIDGLPVLNGTVSVLFERASGDVIAIDNQAVPHARDADPFPRSSSADVLAAAARAYAAKFGFAFTEVDSMEAVIVGPSPFYGRKSALVSRGATLAYLVDVKTPGRIGPNGAPAQARVHVSAAGDLTVFKVEETAHTVDGAAQTNVNVGPEPNTTTNQEVADLKYAYVRQNTTSGTILATTDQNGGFSTGGASAQTLAFEFEGPFCRTNNDQGSEYSLIIPNATTPTAALLNPTKAEFTTAEAAAFYYVNEFRDYVRRVDANDGSMDFQVLANVNKDDLLCNAYYDGGSINLERAGSGCTNTSYQDVVQHEEGHWANNVYNGNVTGAFHEGNADNFAYYINDDPCLTSFGGSGGCLRTALQTSVKKCNVDGDETCNGGASHTEGQALASGVWAVRNRLNITYGNTIGDDLADALFMGWMNAFNDTAILNVIQDHWLALDDDNGDLTDLTPNFGDITGGFGSYNWKFPAPSITITQSPAINVEIGAMQPVPVVATISTIGGLTAADVIYNTNAGGPFSVALVATGNPNEYAATIPGQTSPNQVSWTVSASNAGGGSATVYPGGPNSPGFYHVGTIAPISFFDFEGPGDQGWTHVSLSGGSTGDQFERGNPSGSNESTDPNLAFSGSNNWGTDLSLQGFDGKYEPNGSGELRSPSFNLSGESQVYLQYRRFLAVEEGIYDQAQIRVNGQTVWSNPASGNLLDNQWTLHNLNISALAANNPSVQVTFRLTSDGGLEFGGWNIDDFMIYRVDPTSGGFFQTYGQGCPGTIPVNPSLTGTGFPGPGQNVVVNISGAFPNSAGILLIGSSQASVPVAGSCSLLVSGLVGGGFPLAVGALGSLSLPATLPGGIGMGDVYMQYFAIDPGAPNNQYAASNGLQMHFQ